MKQPAESSSNSPLASRAGSLRTLVLAIGAVLFLVLAVLQGSASANDPTEDVTPPVISGISITPDTVGITNGDASVTLTFDATDAQSGLDYGYVLFTAPDTDQRLDIYTHFDTGNTTTITVPQFSDVGPWTITQVRAIDNAGNEAAYYDFDNTLSTIGITLPTLNVAGIEDITPPVITGIGVTPAWVNTADASAEVTLHFDTTDARSGLDFGYVLVTAPDTDQRLDIYTHFDTGNTTTITVPQFSDVGIWTITEVRAIDNAGNEAAYYDFDNTLSSIGIPLPTIEVFGVGSPPPIPALPAEVTLGGQLPHFTVPAVDAAQDFTLMYTASCPATGVDYSIRVLGQTTPIRTGSMTDDGAGNFSATIAALNLTTSSEAEVTLTVVGCSPDPSPAPFSIYIDPSGIIRDQNGSPIPGATVTLHRSDSETGPFTQVPDGDPIMSPKNTTNPMVTGADGYYGWDTIAGYYVVKAIAPGCTDPVNGDAEVESEILPVPPEQLHIDLIFSCPVPTTCGGAAVTVNLADGDRPTAGDDVIAGTPDRDVIRGLGGNDIICGYGGNDIIVGGAGDDTIYGGDGRDRIYGQTGNDIIRGEGGSDRIWGGNDNDTVFAGSGADRVHGGSGDDTIFGMGGRDRLYGDDGNDVLQGNSQSDYIWGGTGEDTLRGSTGKDVLWGGDHEDALFGGDNSDSLYGQSGADTHDGQRGADTCVGGGDVGDMFTSC